MQCTACNALHDVTQRCCRWLLQTHDRVEGDEFHLKQEFLAVMLGVRRPTVTVVLKSLQQTGLDLEPVWTDPGPETQAARSRVVRVL